MSPFGSLLVAGPVFGEITGTRLRARKHIVRRGGFQAHLVADLIESGERTSVKCRFTIRWWELRFPLAVVAVLFVSWINSPPEESAMILPIIGLGGFGVLNMMLYLAREERRFLINFLGDVVNAREVERGVDTERQSEHRAAE